MKIVDFIYLLVLIKMVSGENAWEIVESRSELEARQEKAAKTSLVAYDKQQMSEEEINSEEERLRVKCGCTVTKLADVGIFVLEYGSIIHPGVNTLALDTTKETGAEDVLIHAYGNSAPNDPSFNKQWALQDLSNNADINIGEGWKEYLSDSKGGDAKGPSVVVAVIDTGIDYNHPDLKDVMWTNPGEIPNNGKDDDGNGIVDDVYGADFTKTTKGTGDPMDKDGHGTHCSGIIHAMENNGKGIAGVASFTKGKVKLMAVKGLSPKGGTSAGFFACLNYAISKGATISSNSWGGEGLDDKTEAIWDTVLRNNPNHLFVAAAGNDNKKITRTNMPCGLKEPNLICVASSTKDDKRSWFSNHGKDFVHVFAPGSDIYSTMPNGKYKSLQGTSMACPMVSGLAALIRSMRSDLTGQKVRELIEANVQKKPGYATFVSSGGLIDVGATIKAVKGGAGPNPPTKVCTNIEIQTARFGDENSYVMSSCMSKEKYDSKKLYKEKCCLAAGTYSLDCKCSFGDGWHGGYVKIYGKEYCKDFTKGHRKTVQVIFG